MATKETLPTHQPHAPTAPKGFPVASDVRLRAAQAQTLTQYQMASAMPRDWRDVSSKLKVACQDPEFAREAFYRKPTESGARREGLGLRFAEEALRLMRNVSIDTAPEMEDEHSVHYRTTLVDFESNVPQSETFRVDKTTAQRDGGMVLATEDQVSTRFRAQCSRVRRALILGMVPADIRAQCLELCRRTASAEDAKDPAGEIKRLVAAFGLIPIDAGALKEHLGKPLTAATAIDVLELRSLHALIRDGEITWRDVVDAERASVSEKAPAPAEKPRGRPKKPAAAPTRPRGNKPQPSSAGGASSSGSTSAPAVVAREEPKPARASRREDEGAEIATSASSPS